jgi:predicted amidohydrolase YtcJ
MATPEKDIDILGPERAAEAYPYRRLLDAGVHLSFGSDIPGEATFDPIYGIHMAVNRAEDARITALEALKAYTLESAYAEFLEKDKGSIREGKLADFTVLDRDFTRVDPSAIKDTRVTMTVVDGSVVYERGET